MPATKLGRSKTPDAQPEGSIDASPTAPDPTAAVFDSAITGMARHFWLTIIPQQLGPAIKDWIADAGNRAEFDKTLDGIGVCDFLLNGSASAGALGEEQQTVTVEAEPCNPTE